MTEPKSDETLTDQEAPDTEAEDGPDSDAVPEPKPEDDPQEGHEPTTEDVMVSGLLEDADRDRALVAEWDTALPNLPTEEDK